jgi:putative membrane protein
MLGILPVALIAAALVGYLLGVVRLSRRGIRWPVGRTGCLLAGAVCVLVAALPPVAIHDEYFPVHVAQHLLLAMIAPAFLALSAPMTLALRTVPPSGRRTLLALMHTRLVRLLSAPVTAVVLNLGGMYVLYLTGLYAAAQESESLHAAVHMHFFLAGCLFGWTVIGIDPVRRRAGVAIRLATLIVAAAGHDILAKLMYAHELPAGAGSIGARHRGAEIMYYGGTLVDLALAAVLMAQWWHASGRELARAERRQAAPGPIFPPRFSGSIPVSTTSAAISATLRCVRWLVTRNRSNA